MGTKCQLAVDICLGNEAKILFRKDKIVARRRECVKWTDVAGYGLDDGETPLLRCKPEGIDELSRVTKFSRKELQIMYRGFKQVRLSPASLLVTVRDFQ